MTASGRFAAAVMSLFLAGCGDSASDLRPVSPPGTLAADGFSTATLAFRSGSAVREPVVEVVEGRRRVSVESVTAEGRSLRAVVRAGVWPGTVVIEARARNLKPARVSLDLTPDLADADGDGTPDCLRLDDEADRRAFAEWFTFLAEAQYYLAPGSVPAEIVDCAALIRFAYREALREHDGGWAEDLDLPSVPKVAGVRKYQYPYTLTGASLFRVRPGPMKPDDADNGGFAEFADAETLMRRNTFLIGRDVSLAVRGDLLFYRQLGQSLPFHAMVYVGRSHFKDDGRAHVVYHTGPSGKTRGEIRRLPLGELMRHPLPQWRPAAGNANFLGVFRWNILRD